MVCPQHQAPGWVGQWLIRGDSKAMGVKQEDGEGKSPEIKQKAGRGADELRVGCAELAERWVWGGQLPGEWKRSPSDREIRNRVWI